MNRIGLFLAATLVSGLLVSTSASGQILGGGGGLGGVVGGPLGGVGGGIGVGGAVTGPALPRAPRAPRVREVPAARVPDLAAEVDVGVVPSLGYLGAVDGARRSTLIEQGVVVLPARDAVVYMDQQYLVFRDDLVGSGVTVERRGEAIVLQMPADVTFAFDRYELQPRFVPVLARVAETLRRYPATYVDVIGHADAIGTDGYNQVLSERRAATVADFLVAYDAQPARLFVAGRGESEPVASNASVWGRAANRRVEIILYPHT